MSNRRSVSTSRFSIASYWASDGFINDNCSFVVDLNEPSCFACGYFADYWDEHKSAETRWNKSGLERAHVLAHSIGGEDSPMNLLLLCKRCHEASPMTNNRITMLTWVSNRRSFVELRVSDILSELTSLGVDASELSKLDVNNIIPAANGIGAGMHLGLPLVRLSSSTIANVVLEAIRMSSSVSPSKMSSEHK